MARRCTICGVKSTTPSAKTCGTEECRTKYFKYKNDPWYLVFRRQVSLLKDCERRNKLNPWTKRFRKAAIALYKRPTAQRSSPETIPSAPETWDDLFRREVAQLNSVTARYARQELDEWDRWFIVASGSLNLRQKERAQRRTTLEKSWNDRNTDAPLQVAC